MTLKTINPTTGQLIKEYPLLNDQQIKQIIEDCHYDFLHWSSLSYKERAMPMQNLAELLLKNKEYLAKLIAEEMGKPISQGKSEIEKCSSTCDYFAKNTEELLQPEIIKTELSKSYVVYQPLGIVLGIMPWNFPIWQVLRFAIPNLMVGNGCLLKHAEISTGTAFEIEKLIQQAHFPTNIFRVLAVENQQTPAIIAHQHVVAVTLTGSPKAGQAVGSEAGKNLKKIVLELGGNDPYLILEDADLEAAATICLNSRLNNSGQVCIAAKRIFVVEQVYDEFLSLIKAKMQDYRLGNPLDNNTQIGPLAREDLREKVHNQVKQSVKAGAKLLLGGELVKGKGFYYPPTLLTDITPNMSAFNEEIFGPVVSIIKVKNEKEAIKLANQTEYGLGAAIFTKNQQRGEEIALNQLKAGTCAVNTFVRSDPRLPFGGIKNSGYGRELAKEGLISFLNIKTILVN